MPSDDPVITLIPKSPDPEGDKGKRTAIILALAVLVFLAFYGLKFFS